MSNNPVWDKQSKALKKVQLHFQFTEKTGKDLRHEAIESNMTPSHYLRSLIGLEAATTARPRIGLSLTDKDFEVLGAKYNLSPENRDEIKEQVMRDIELQFREKRRGKLRGGDISLDDVNKSQFSEGLKK